MTPLGIYRRLRDALGWRIRQIAGDNRVDSLFVKLAQRWRPLLTKPVFIGIAGSGGKTTTKELLQGVLSSKRTGIANPASLNALPEVAKTILRVRPSHDFCIAELSEDRPGLMDQNLALLRPSVAIVTVVRDDHLAAHASRETLTREMAQLIAALPTTGTAVLNADDEDVMAMAAGCNANIITYGTSSHANLRAEDVRSNWPERLSMTLVRGDKRVTVQTQLCGTHWVPSVLGAVGGGLATGMTLSECAAGMANVAPFEGRMQPVTTADGVTFIRDDFKAPLWTLDACFDFMKAANAKRKIIVIGELSDIDSKKEREYAKTAVLAQQIADLTIYVGPWASSVLRARDSTKVDGLHVFSRVRSADVFLDSMLRQGDLVLLKGTNKQDHLQRIILSRSQAIACWRDDCQRIDFCDQCPERMRPSGRPTLQPESAAPGPVTSVGAVHAMQAFDQVIVGLGNPGAQYANTPHNVGYDAVDQLAAALGFAWAESPLACMAQGDINGQAVCLLKIAAPMNLIGSSLKQLGANLGVEPAQCILVFDDLALPLGTVKTRQRGSAGGHRGVASTLEAFQTDTFRRVKIGVGQAEYKTERTKYVLAPFAEGDQAAVRTSIEKAVTSIRSLLSDSAALSASTTRGN